MNKIFQFQYASVRIQDLTEEQTKTVRAAQEAVRSSYAPYSKFRVGCALLLDNGAMVQGSNMENAAYAATICAERTAISQYHISHAAHKIVKIAIAYAYELNPSADSILSPCGECRQVIAEAAMRQSSPIEVILYASDEHIIIIHSHEDLLPFSFSKKNLA